MHYLYWVENAPKLDKDGEDAVCSFFDKYVSYSVLSLNQDVELREIVLAVQQHSKKHSKSCKKREPSADSTFQDRHLCVHL